MKKPLRETKTGDCFTKNHNPALKAMEASYRDDDSKNLVAKIRKEISESEEESMTLLSWNSSHPGDPSSLRATKA